jgi:predicted nucleic acid-binding protein
MKLLVDTCVWSLALRRRATAKMSAVEQQTVAQLREAIQDRRVAIIGPIRQEVLSGIRDKTQFARTAELLEPFRDEEILASDYIEAARLFNLCRGRGVQCGPIDMLLLAVGVRNGLEILTDDQGLKRCMEILKAAELLC